MGHLRFSEIFANRCLKLYYLCPYDHITPLNVVLAASLIFTLLSAFFFAFFLEIAETPVKCCPFSFDIMHVQFPSSFSVKGPKNFIPHFFLFDGGLCIKL